MSFNYPLIDQQGQTYQQHHVNNDHAAFTCPQLDGRPLACHIFLDFVTPNEHATIPVMGTSQALESLNRALSAGVFARRTPSSSQFSAYAPLAIALNAVCAQAGVDSITERDLAQLHHAPWFADFAKAVVKRHNADGQVNINCDNLVSDSCLSEDHMVLLVEAFAASMNLSKIELGIVAISKKGVKAFLYPWTAACNGLTAWVVADLRTEEPVYYGLGREIVELQEGTNDEEGEHESEKNEGTDNEEVPTVTPRKTAARVLDQQVPLRAGLSAKVILECHTDNLQYNNILKVGLHYSNQEIAKKVAETAVGSAKKFSTGASGVVKRINTGIDFIEKEFGMDAGAFRTAYDTARKDNGIPIRSKDGVDDQVLAANASKIDKAMTWIKTGGPRPDAAAAAPAPVAAGHAPAPTGYAPVPPVATNLQRPVNVHNDGSFSQLDSTMDEPDQDYKYAPRVQSDSFLSQFNETQPDWDSMVDDTLMNFDDTFD